MKFALLLAGLLALGPMAAPAAALPDASQIAAQIGQRVEFEDVIQAISFSRSRKGYYFSFGAPYPKQSLSVWVTEDLYEQLPRDPGLMGRRVRIRGQLENSPTGPMLSLASPDDFELLEVKDAMLSKSFLDGRMDREQFMAAVGQAFWREDFATLELLGQELQQSRERFSEGTWILNAFFQALAVNRNESDARFAEASEKIARWLTSHPASPFALVAQAGYQLNLAWHGRAAETSAGREEARRAVTRAREILEANPAAKVVPEYFVKMEWVAFEQGWTREAFSQVFEEAIARERDYYTTYFQAAYFLLDGVRSERGGWERLAEEQRRRRGGEEGDALYTRIAWSMSVNYRDLFGKSAISWDVMAAGFQRLMRDYPESRWLKNAYANFAWKADDRERLRPALAAIEANPDMGIWVNLANVELAKKFGAGK